MTWRILSVHNRYQVRGGEDETQAAEAELLRRKGNLVHEHVVDNQQIQNMNAARVAVQAIWSGETYRTIRAKLRTYQSTILHVHNYLPLISPSVYYAARAEGVPVVQTLHNYRLLCPNGLFFRDGSPCELCIGKAFPWPGIVHRCYRGSGPGSLTVAAMLSVHRAFGTWNKMVDVYIALTEFARQKFIEGGIPEERIVVKPHFVAPDPGLGEGDGGYALYVGRLSPEKGLRTLLSAWRKLEPQWKLYIVGDGPMAEEVQFAARNYSTIEWLGQKPIDEVYQIMGSADVLVVPSECYETFGRVVVEAFAKGTPVICSAIGAVGELVEDGRTGLCFQPGNVQDLVGKLEFAFHHPSQIAQMRLQARSEFERRYSADQNYEMMHQIYSRAINKSKVVSR